MAVTKWLKQSTAVTVKVGPFVDNTDGDTAEGGLTITQADVRLSKNGANMAQKNDATSLTHDEEGMYDCPLDATDTNTLGNLTLVVHESGSLHVRHDYAVVPANVWDSLFSTDRLQVHAAEITNDLITAASIAADAIGASEIAANAIGASELATDAVSEIRDAILSDSTPFAGANIDAAITSRLAPTVAARTLDVTAGGAAGVDWGNVENPGTAVDLSATDIQLADTVTSLTGHTAQTGDNFARLGAPAGVSVSADIAAIKADTGAALSPLASGTAQAGTASTIQLAAAHGFANDELNGTLVNIISGTGAGQSRVITAYVGATDTATVTPNWTTNPDATSVYEVVGGSTNVTAVSNAAEDVATETTAASRMAEASISTTGGAVDTVTAVTNQVTADVTAISGDTAAADNLEADYDGTGYNKSASTVGTVTALTGHTAQTGDNFARLGAPAGVSVSADIAAVKTDTAAVLVDTADMQPKLGTPAADLAADIAALNDISVADILTTQMTEAYAADGVAPTLAQAICLIQQSIGDFSISGTTLTVKKLDGSTTAATYTLDDATDPTSRTRAT